VIARLAGLSAVVLVGVTIAALPHGDAAWIMDNPRDRVHCCGPSACRREHAAKFP